MYEEIFAGLGQDAAEHFCVTFNEGHQEMVLVRDIPLYSVCEHHLVPFIGRAHVAYVPGKDGRICGLSKLARVVDVFAKRPQVQERMTSQIADTIVEHLKPAGVIVVIEAEHLCMSMRGVKKPGAITTTSAVRGIFATQRRNARRGDVAHQGSVVSAPARVWRCGAFSLALEDPLVMGILNVTPDSFSDGGLHADARAAIGWGREMAHDGASIVDVGGESTRPGAGDVSVAEELARVLPVVEALAADGIVVSIDTRHAGVARACLEAGASIVNDVSGFRDPGMREVAAGCDAGVVVMHMLGEPKTMQDEPRYDDVVAEIGEYLRAQAAVLEVAGVARERIAIDPGIGFGKTLDHNLELLRRLPEIATLGYPVVVGASRKRFIGMLTGQDVPAERLEGSLVAAAWAASAGASVVRVHDVPETVRALEVAMAIAGFGPVAGRE